MKPVFVMVVFAILCSPAAVAQSQGPANAPPASAGQTAGATAARPAQSSPAEEKLSPEALARKYLELWNTGNFDLINSTFVFPAIMTSRGHHQMLTSGMLKRVITTWRKSMPDLNFKVEDTIVQGNKVVMRLSFTGTYKGRLFPNTADPKVHPTGLRATAMWIIETRDGKIRQIWEEYDEIRMHYVMGGMWRTNAEMEGAAKASVSGSQPAPESAPESAPEAPEPAPEPKP